MYNLLDMKKIVLTYGTFDLFHHGHENILKEAKKFGDYLIVGLSTDEFNLVKGKVAHDTYEQRMQNLIASGLVDEVIPEVNWDQKVEDIKKNNVDVFVMGSDWSGKFDELKKFCQVEYPSRTKGISSTMLRAEIKKDKI